MARLLVGGGLAKQLGSSRSGFDKIPLKTMIIIYDGCIPPIFSFFITENTILCTFDANNDFTSFDTIRFHLPLPPLPFTPYHSLSPFISCHANQSIKKALTKVSSTNKIIPTLLPTLPIRSLLCIWKLDRSSRGTDSHIGIADGLSRMPTSMLETLIDLLAEGLPMAAITVESRPLRILERGTHSPSCTLQSMHV